MSNALSPDQLLTTLYNVLLPWTQQRGGYLSIAGDPGEVIEALTDKPNGFRVVLNWAGDEDQTGQELAGVVTNTFEVWLIKSKGLQLVPGTHLITGNPPFLSLFSDLREQVRGCIWPIDATNQYALYKGAKQFEPEIAWELPTTGYKMTFELIAGIPALF